MIATAAIIWALLASVLGIWACFGWISADADRRAMQKQLDQSRSEGRRLSAWAAHWQKQATSLADYLSRTPSRRGSHARACQAERQKALVADTTQRLAAGR
jgi:hypothetical protein